MFVGAIKKLSLYSRSGVQRVQTCLQLSLSWVPESSAAFERLRSCCRAVAGHSVGVGHDRTVDLMMSRSLLFVGIEGREWLGCGLVATTDQNHVRQRYRLHSPYALVCRELVMAASHPRSWHHVARRDVTACSVATCLNAARSLWIWQRACGRFANKVNKRPMCMNGYCIPVEVFTDELTDLQA